MKNCLIFSILLMVGCSSTNINQLLILDKSTGTPIEGAWVHNNDDNSVLRSNIKGIVELPNESAASRFDIISKYHNPKSINLNDLVNGKILLQIDSSRINQREASFTFTMSDTLIGAYSQFRSNNDLLFYDLDIKLDIDNKYINGRNAINFRMLEDASKIQIDLHDTLAVDSILFNDQKLNFNRKYNSVFIDFPIELKKYEIYKIDFYYSGYPKETGRFGGIVFDEDSLGNPWVFTACQGPGANVWWPNKDQQFDEPDSMHISITVPKSLKAISNGHLISQQDISDELIKYNWKVSYPINNYCVALNVANYIQFEDQIEGFPINYFVQPYHFDDAKEQFKQVVPMLKCFEKYFGSYPFPKDVFKLIEVPYSGMEHQTAVAYGNGYKNGYLGRDWTGVGISDKFDFIIIHESGHEWFGNIITAADDSDAWIHEGWTTYAEAVYVECLWGYQDALKYLNGYKDKIRNTFPIIGPIGVNHWPTGDMYFKGALFLNTLRSIVDDDELWWSMIYDYSNHFRGQNIYTNDVITYINNYLKRNLTSIFEQYLLFSDLPKLQLRYNGNKVDYRWETIVKNFDMPIKAGNDGEWDFIYPSNDWQTISVEHIQNWGIDTNKFYIDLEIM